MTLPCVLRLSSTSCRAAPSAILATVLCGVTATCSMLLVIPVVHASAVMNGLNTINGTVDLPSDDVRTTVTDTVNFLIGFIALAAVVTIIAAGFFLIMGLGSETSVTRAKKIILYTIVGVLIIFFVRVIVGFFTGEIAGLF